MSGSVPLVDAARLRSHHSQDDARKIKPLPLFFRGRDGYLFLILSVIFSLLFALFSGINVVFVNFPVEILQLDRKRFGRGRMEDNFIDGDKSNTLFLK